MDPAPTLQDWLEHRTPLDPVLREPLQLHGSRSRRRDQARALLGALGFEEAVLGTAADSTLALVHGMRDELADALHERTIDIGDRAARIAASSGSDPSGLVQAMADLGWDGVELAGGTVGEVVVQLNVAYVRGMATCVARTLGGWRSRGWVIDPRAA